MDCGNTSSFAAAEDSCISWGTAQHGELGYGPTGPKYVLYCSFTLLVFFGICIVGVIDLVTVALTVYFLSRSSANPKKVDALEGFHTISVACGLGHSLVIVDTEKNKEKLEQVTISNFSKS